MELRVGLPHEREGPRLLAGEVAVLPGVAGPHRAADRGPRERHVIDADGTREIVGERAIAALPAAANAAFNVAVDSPPSGSWAPVYGGHSSEASRMISAAATVGETSPKLLSK